MRLRIYCSAALSLSLFSTAAVADFTKTVTVTPGVETTAVTTWYYLNCSTSRGLGSYTVNVAPAHGVLAFADVSGPLPGCPAGSPSLPAVAAYYTWTDTTTLDTSDYFQLYYMLNGAVAEVDDITVALASPTPGEPCSSIMTSQTVASVPNQPDSRTIIGVGEVVSLKTTYPATWFIQGDGVITEPTNGACPVSMSTSVVYGTEACFTAPYLKGETNVNAVLDSGISCSIPLTVVEPTGLIFQRVEASGYAYGDPAYVGEIGMFSVALLIPGNVSFANIGVAEQDHKNDADNYIAPPYTPPVLVRVDSNTNAWLVGCDKDVTPLFPDFFVFNWVYTWGSDHYLTASKQQFATVETQLTFPLAVWLFQKGQIAPGIFNTFIEPTATLAVPVLSPPSVMGTLNRSTCLTDITSQLGIVAMSR